MVSAVTAVGENPSSTQGQPGPRRERVGSGTRVGSWRAAEGWRGGEKPRAGQEARQRVGVGREQPARTETCETGDGRQSQQWVLEPGRETQIWSAGHSSGIPVRRCPNGKATASSQKD